MNGNGSEFRTPLKQARGLGSAKDGTGHFLWQRVTAIAVVLAGAWLLGLLLSLGAADYAHARVIVADPFNATVLVAFLIAACWHAKLGMQVVIEDYIHQRVLEVGLLVVIRLTFVLAVMAGTVAVMRLVFLAAEPL